MASKICKCALIDAGGVLVPTPVDGLEKLPPIIIAPDADGELWYWDGNPYPEPEAPAA